jgi:FKBP-type peptidyl-prolyl cis-trans isomerase SlyD
MVSDAVAPDMFVALRYRLFDEAGSEVDARGADAPLVYVHGYAQIIPGLEAGLEGARPGEHRTLVLGPDEAFGERDEMALIEIDPNDFPDARHASVGDEVMAEAPDGTEVAFRIVSCDERAIVVDRNHPLAGQSVRFEIEVLTVRPASDDELDAAQADAHERVVYESTIVYGSEPSEGGAMVSAPELVQLRAKRLRDDLAAVSGDEEES